MTRYDEAPYACHPIPSTAPEQLALAALLHGGPSPPVTGARVLEIGCGDGANLLPMAFFRPDCRFVGVDASGVQIADASRSVETLSLANVELHAADVRDAADTLGEFDYIVAHGVMSWVPDAVRDAIFALCRNHLAENGLVYLSYNTNPGWSIRGLVRNAMLRPRARRTIEALTSEARARAGVLRAAIESATHPYALLLAQELGRAEVTSESSLLHDYLSPRNRAYWFGDFAERAAAFGFRYLVEAAYRQPEYRVPAAIGRAARELESDPLKIEGLIDVLWYRQHRASLFCRTAAVGAALPRDALFGRLTIAAGCKPESEPVSLEPGVAQTFTGLAEPEIATTSSDALDKAVLTLLADVWPLGVEWEALMTQAREMLHDNRLPPPDAAAEKTLQDTLIELHGAGQAELRLRALPVPRLVRYPPALSPLSRWEAERRGVITTPTHMRLAPTETDRLILGLLAGEQSPPELARSVVARLRTDGRTENVPESMTVEEWIDGMLSRDLQLMARWGLLQ